MDRESERWKRFTSGGLHRVWWLTCICHLEKGQKCRGGCRVPLQDHPQGFYNAKTGERVFIHQPYIGPFMLGASEQHMAEVEPIRRAHLEAIEKRSRQFAAEHGLKVRISVEDSWHRPGETVLVEFRK